MSADHPQSNSRKLSQPPVQCSKPGGVIVPHTVKWHQRLAAALVYVAIRGVAATLRTRFDDRCGLFEQETPQPLILCIWHNRLALSLMILRNYMQRRQSARRLAALVSASKDGALVARILEHFGVQPVRGSTSRRGPQALLELTTWAERGLDVAFTVDGPRGPRYVVQEGAIALAQLTGHPIVPVSDHLSAKIHLKSWDRFQIPLPFARWHVVWGRPIQVPREATETERERLRQELENGLKAITQD